MRSEYSGHVSPTNSCIGISCGWSCQSDTNASMSSRSACPLAHRSTKDSFLDIDRSPSYGALYAQATDWIDHAEVSAILIEHLDFAMECVPRVVTTAILAPPQLLTALEP